MSIHTLAKTCWEQMAKHERFAEPLVERADDKASEARLRGRSYALISSHLPYGVHARLMGAPLLLTVLRDPVSRVRSAYAYHCMHHGETVDPIGLEKFARRKENRNTMTRLLSGLDAGEEVDPAAHEQARENLTQNFALFATTKDIPALCETVLQACALPNVIAPHINKTPAEYGIDASAFTEEINACNSYDARLFQYVSTHKKCALNATDGGQPTAREHPFTVILVEQRHGEEMIAKGFMVPTAFLREIKLLGEDATIDDDIYRDFIRSVQAQGALD
ncbi:hypothetical protein [Varunaivibrio sulfuroxidans]|nr:hypothetical protein [Varunaivibrio sulfuroxidans]WES30784.1 hypothetical protein P3M64_14305 [Varunaivibrio sulfuroxidans]